jgi:ketosteroid isomerase-like protein
MAEEHPARLASQRSMAAVRRKAKEEWLALFADDAVVEDPVGKSPLDPEGKGQVGKTAIGRFWDTNIGPNDVDFEIRHSYAAGNEVANVGAVITTMPGGMKAVAEGVFVYRVDGEGKLLSLRAFWEFDQMMKSLAQHTRQEAE